MEYRDDTHGSANAIIGKIARCARERPETLDLMRAVRFTHIQINTYSHERTLTLISVGGGVRIRHMEANR